MFTYRFEEVDSFYIMRCPRPDCDSPVFNRHPLLGDRAAEHLVRCGQPFETERDLVRRYARLGRFFSFHFASAGNMLTLGRISHPHPPGFVPDRAHGEKAQQHPHSGKRAGIGGGEL